MLLLFGRDADAAGIGMLKKYRADGFAFVALDMDALAVASKANLPHYFLEDLLNADEIQHSRKVAMQCMDRWYMPVRDFFTWNGVCWPKFDVEAMVWFWLDIIPAENLVQKLLTLRVRQVVQFFQQDPDYALYYYPTQTIKNYIRSRLGDVARHVNLQSPPGITKENDKPPETDKTRDWKCFHDRLILCLNYGEHFRFTPLVEEEIKAYAGNIAAILTSSCHKSAANLARLWKIPVNPLDNDGLVDPLFLEKCSTGYNRLLHPRFQHEPWFLPLNLLSDHFHHYLFRRWPQLSAQLNTWKQLWLTVHPRAIGVSSLEDAESQLPTEAARVLGIPTLSFPHGDSIQRSAPPSEADVILCSSGLNKEIYKKKGVGGEKIVLCRNVVAKNEYEATQRDPDQFFPRDSFKILVLSGPTGRSGEFPKMSQKALLLGLATLGDIPKDLKEKVSFAIKPHPALPELVAFSLGYSVLDEKLVPPDTQLGPLIEAADLIIDLCFSGAALVHAIRAQKPILFFWINGSINPFIESELFLSAGEVVTDSESFWPRVRTLFHDRFALADLKARCCGFHEKYFDDDRYSTIRETLEHRLFPN